MVGTLSEQPKIIFWFPLICINNCMNQSDYLTQQATREYALRYSDLITHAVTFQSFLRPFNANDKKLIAMRDAVSRSFRNCLCRMNREMYKNAAKRKPATHRPIVIASIEGLNSNDRELTVHVHAGFGNVSAQYRNDLPALQKLAEHCWRATKVGTADVDVRPTTDSPEGWLGYSTTERDLTYGDFVSWGLIQVPSAYLRD